jgi:hypothetical protein
MPLISVDLPAPLSPTSAITSPARTSKSTRYRHGRRRRTSTPRRTAAAASAPSSWRSFALPHSFRCARASRRGGCSTIAPATTVSVGEDLPSPVDSDDVSCSPGRTRLGDVAGADLLDVRKPSAMTVSAMLSAVTAIGSARCTAPRRPGFVGRLALGIDADDLEVTGQRRHVLTGAQRQRGLGTDRSLAAIGL